MGTRAGWLLLFATVLECGVGGGVARGRVWVDEAGAYRDLVLAIHPSFIPNNCSAFFTNLKVVLSSFSRRLWRSTEGQVYVGDVKVVVPGPLWRACGMAPLARATWHRWTTADIRLSPGDSFVSSLLHQGDGAAWRPDDNVSGGSAWTPEDSVGGRAAWTQEDSVDGRAAWTQEDSLRDGAAWAPENSVGGRAAWTQEDSLRGGATWGPEGSVGVSVAQPEGCGRPGQYITLDPRLLLHLQHQHHQRLLRTVGGSLVAAWARYRWGVFEERGYHLHPRYPATYLRDGTVTPTSCTNRHHSSSQRWGECGEAAGCTPVPDWAATVNTSLLYRTDLPQMWGFCDGSSHDREAPTPHNLLCEGSSVWEVVSRHPDLARHWTHTAHHTHASQELFHNNKNFSSSEEASETQNVTFSSVEQHKDSPPVSTDEKVSSDDVNRDLVVNNNTVPRENVSGTPIPPQQVILNHENVKRRRKRREKSVKEAGSGSRALPPSLVTAHIDSSSRRMEVDVEAADEARDLGAPDVPDRTLLPQDWTPPPRDLGVPDVPAGTPDKTPKPRDPGVPDVQAGTLLPPGWTPTPLDLGVPDVPAETPDGTPPAPEVVLLAASTNALVLALDLSEQAVSQVNMDALRGGILRWLWGLGKEVLVGVLAAYNNASYPLTIGPLLPAPTTASELEDQVRLLPLEEEVEDGVYGGHYCLTCVLAQATKMLEEAGVEVEAGVVLVAACSPGVTTHNLAQTTQANFTIHTFALCPTTDLLFDQLAGPGSSWVLPGPTPPGEQQHLRREEEVAVVLGAATRAALAAPGDVTLVKVGGSVSEVTEVDVQSGGPYSTVTGNVTLPPAHHHILMVVTTQYQAKVVEVTNPSGAELDMMRDTSQRFWAVLDPAVGPQLTYVLKFLTSSIEFPFAIRVDLYERKQDNIGLEVRLHTNNDGHLPLQPESRPLVVFAEVTLDGHPVVGSKVMLRVSHLSEDGATDMMVELLDNGNAEPDVRAEDGVYSRYLTWLPREGRYALTATATALPTPRVTEGQVMPLTTSGVVALTVARVTSADLIPPSRVTDLAVTLVHNSTVNLTWSAPGGDLDQGSAQLYQLKMYTEHSALTEEKFNSPAITVYCLSHDLDSPSQTPGTYSSPSQIPGTYSSRSQTPGTYGSPSQIPSTYGSPQYCLTHLPFTNLRWYFAIRAVDSSNNTGRISNIVSAYVPDPATTLPPTVPSSDLPSSVQTVIMSTVTSKNPHGSQTQTNATNRDYSKTATHDWRVWVAVGIGVGGVAVVLLMCICCCRRNQNNEEKDPDRPVYKIYVNNAYIQEEDGGVKVVSSGKLVENEEPSQVQEWVNSLSKFGSSDVYGAEHGESSVATTDAPLVECRPRACIKYASPVRFGVLTNGSIMREACASSSSTSSSKPSDDPSNDDVKYRDLSETTSNSTTDGGASAASTATTDTAPPLPILDGAQTVPMNVKPINGNLSSPLTPSQLLQQPLGIPGPTVISIHSGPAHNNGYSSDEEGGFRPRTLQGPGPRRYLPTHFSSFRYLPPPPEYRSAVGGSGPVAYPTCHTISRATATLPHGTVRSVKKRRHISFV